MAARSVERSVLHSSHGFPLHFSDATMLPTDTHLPKASMLSVLKRPLFALFFATLPAFALAQAETVAGPVTSLAVATPDELLKIANGNLFVSRDAGRSWSKLDVPAEAAGRMDKISVAAGDDHALYAAGPEIGLFASKDDGESWSEATGDLPGTHVTAFATHASEADTLYAYIPEKGIYRTRNAGVEWAKVSRGPEPREGALTAKLDAVVGSVNEIVHTGMEGSMETGWIYVATSEGLRISQDCFCLWREVGDFPGSVEAVAADPAHPEDVYAAAGATLSKSSDGGRSWSDAAAPESAVTALAVGAEGVVFAGTEDGGLFVSRDHAESWTRADD
ncbi:WD40/YVTN/BNR-like repeat-containing protein [Afifella sp. YEN Y35]|uniref:WD40/YVTN/BNR-like repeat-containing protein n=1 Tax=Afifella sp. YEN Y35 TaxID=3388337 RepID=UPI0039E0B01F